MTRMLMGDLFYEKVWYSATLTYLRLRWKMSRVRKNYQGGRQ